MDAEGRDATDDAFDRAAAATDGTEPALLRRVVAHAPVGIGLLDTDLRWQFVNAEFTRTTGLRAADLVGLPVGATPFARDADTLGSVLADGRPRESPPWDGSAHAAVGPHARYRRLDLPGRVAGIIVAVVDAGPPARHRTPELQRAHERLAVLDAAAKRIGTTLDIDTTCAELAEFAVPAMADLAIVEALPPDDTDHGSTVPKGQARLRRAGLACVPALRARLASLAPTGESVLYPAESAVARSLRTGTPVATNPLADTEPNNPTETTGTLASLRTAGIDSTLVVPLVAHGRAVGVLVLARADGSSPGFTDHAVVLAEDLAARAAVGIDHARRYTHAQGIAVELQRALLTEPGKPHPNLELAFRYLPSGTTSVVGGDWYEIVRLSFGRTLLVMGDVMGHGVEAAVDMSNYRSTLRHVAAMDLPPHRILRRLDAIIDANESARPATCLLALADPNRDRWTFSSAGHLPPALIAPDRPIELVEVPTGPPLGTGFGGYEQVTRDLLPEEILLLYTDGLVERRDQDIDDSLAALAALRPPTTGALDDLLDAVLHGSAPHTGEDDIAILAARVRPR